MNSNSKTKTNEWNLSFTLMHKHRRIKRHIFWGHIIKENHLSQSVALVYYILLD